MAELEPAKDTENATELSEEQKAKIEQNRLKALELRRKRQLQSTPVKLVHFYLT